MVKKSRLFDVLDCLAESSIILPGCMPKGDGLASRMGWTTKIIVLCSVVGVMSGVLLAGCKVNSDDVEQWKGTVKGPTRLVAVIGSDRYSRELRTEAALAIVEMDRSDVDALTLLKGALDDLRGGDAEATEAIVGGMIPRLEALLSEEPDPAASAPDPTQVRAKDAAYMVIPTLRRRAGTGSSDRSSAGIRRTSKAAALPETTAPSR